MSEDSTIHWVIRPAGNADAVMFLNPRNSQVDVIQAVGRAMRSFKNADTGGAKKFGYVISPIAIPEGTTPEAALRETTRGEPLTRRRARARPVGPFFNEW